MAKITFEDSNGNRVFSLSSEIVPQVGHRLFYKDLLYEVRQVYYWYEENKLKAIEITIIKL